MIPAPPDSLLGRVDAYLNVAPLNRCRAIPLEGFTLFLNSDTDAPWFTYARPTSHPPVDAARAVAAARRRFEECQRTPRWEWIDEVAPWLSPALAAQGLVPELTPLMVVTPADFRPEAATGCHVRAIRLEDPPEPLIRLQRAAFELPDEPPSLAEIAMVQAYLQRGGTFLVAECDGAPAGTGGHLPIDGVTEIAGIGTHPAHRRRGVGGTVSSALIAEAFAGGCGCVFLTAGNDAAVRLYRRLGFRTVARGMQAMAP